MLSNSCKYAIRAVLYLAIYSNPNKKLSSKNVANFINVPAPFLAKIFQKLSKNRIILSSKGPHGGFYLTQKELENNLLDIIACIDGLGVFNNCYLGLPKCSDESPCSIHHIIVSFKKNLKEEILNKTIAETASETEKGKTFILLK